MVESSQRVDEIKNSEEKDIDSESDTEYDIDYEEARWNINIFLNVPTEVASMIYSYLEPQDFLSLYKGSRKHFEFLRRIPSIWIKDLNLPQLSVPMKSNYDYCDLMLGNNCMICDKSISRLTYGGLTYAFDSRVRICDNCGLQCFVRYDQLQQGDIDGSPLLLSFFPESICFNGKYFTKQCHIIINRYKELSQARLRRRNTSRAQATIRLRAFVQERTVLHDQLRNDHYLLQNWHQNRLDKERTARTVELRRRKQLFEDKLFNLGNDRPLFQTSSWHREFQLNEPLRFTKSILLKAGREVYLNERRERKNQITVLVDAHYDENYHNTPFGPSRTSFKTLPTIKHLTEYDDGLPPSINVINEYRDYIFDDVHSYRYSLAKTFLFDLADARKLASNLGNSSIIDPTPIELDKYGAPLLPFEVFNYRHEDYTGPETDLLMVAKLEAKRKITEYNAKHLSCITSAGVCSMCKKPQVFTYFSIHHGTRCQYPPTVHNGEWNQHIILDPRRINLLWRMLDMLCWNELCTTSKMMDSLGETWSCVECMKTEETSSLEFGVNKRSWRKAVNHSLNDHDEELFPTPPMCISFLERSL